MELVEDNKLNVQEIEFELRELKGSDLFKVSGIIGKLDIKDELLGAFQGATSEDVETRGMEVIAGLAQSIMVRLPEIEKDLNTFLAELAGVKLKTVQDLPLNDYMALLSAFLKKEELKSFLASVTSFMK